MAGLDACSDRNSDLSNLNSMLDIYIYTYITKYIYTHKKHTSCEKNSINNENYNLTKNILECFIAADKDFDEAESFDLKQIILLMSNQQADVDLISKSITKKIKSIEPGVSFARSKLFNDFLNYCTQLKLIEDEYFKKQIFYYCRLLISSDGEIHPNEQLLLLKLKDFSS